MSLHETIIIGILERNQTLDHNLTQYYSDMINQYKTDSKNAFVLSVLNKHFQLADYFLSKIKRDEIYNSFLSALKNVIHNLNNIDNI